MNNELEWERIIDPEKIFHLQKAGWEIEVTAGTVWVPWDVKVWNSSWSFRARPPKPKMKQVKMSCYLVGNYLHWCVKIRRRCITDELDSPAAP